MKLLFVVPILTLIQTSLNAQSGNITGTVTGSNGQIRYATVTISGTNRSCITDSSGRFYFNNIPYCKKALLISAAEYENSRLSFQLNQSGIDLPIFLHQQVSTIDEVVITGTMKAVSKMSSPIPVEVYSPAYFKKNPSPNIFESLQMVNGVQPQLNCNVCNTGDIHINGMEGPYTMILIDGMPIVSSLSTVYGLAGIPNSIIKRIEIVKGPASTLYGSEAVGGLINIITKDALSAEKLKVDISSTSIGELNTDISNTIRLKNAATFISLNYFNYQQRRDINEDNFTDAALQNRLSIFNKWNFRRKNSLNTSVAFRFIKENRWGGEMQWKPSYRGSNIVYGESIYTNRAEIIGNTVLTKNVNFDLSYNYHLQDSYYGTVKYYANQQVAFIQFRWTHEYKKHSLLAGIPLRYTYYNDGSPATLSAKDRHSLLPGIFIQDEFKITEKFTALAGLRYDHNNIHGNIFTPRLSFKCSPGKDQTIRLSGGNGYRVVNLFTEDHAALTGAREVVIASALSPEKSWNGNLNYSLVVKHNKGFINFDISAFYTYFTNKIVGDFITDPRKIIYDNLKGYAVSKGITINSDVNFTGGLKINAGATLMDVYEANKDNNGKKIKIPELFAPNISGTFSISYALTKQKLVVDLTGRVNGSMYLPIVQNDFRDSKSPLYTVLNLQVTKSWKGGFEIYAGIKNILNFLPKYPILHPDDPFNKRGGKYFDINGLPRTDTNPYGYEFDPSYNYAALQGAKLFTGIRWQLKQ